MISARKHSVLSCNTQSVKLVKILKSLKKPIKANIFGAVFIIFYYFSASQNIILIFLKVFNFFHQFLLSGRFSMNFLKKVSQFLKYLHSLPDGFHDLGPFFY